METKVAPPRCPERIRTNLRLFQPGQSGNPRGRPKRDHDIAELARAYSREAVDTLAQIMMDQGAPAASRVSAANSLLDRAYGKPPQNLDLNHSNSFTDQFEAFVTELQAGRNDQVIAPTMGSDHD